MRIINIAKKQKQENKTDDNVNCEHEKSSPKISVKVSRSPKKTEDMTMESPKLRKDKKFHITIMSMTESREAEEEPKV